ncbi:hypothetical protein HDU98_002297, partial [Podochytrium sp. JEL0797]
MLFKSALTAALLSLVSAHGMMQWPSPRLYPGDADNGFTIARSASLHPCHGLSAGPVLTQALTGGKGSIDYIITAAHQGGCTVLMDRGNGWETIGSHPSCGTHSHSGSIDINIPSGDYSAVIRWHYASDNYSGEEFNTCSDVTVSSTGSNSHDLPSIEHQEECNLLDDRQCTPDGGFKQCGAVLNGSGFWFPKSCPNGLVCVQDVASGNGVVGHVSCGRGDVGDLVCTESDDLRGFKQCAKVVNGVGFQELTGGKGSIDYIITAAHQGGCTVLMDRGNGWETIGSHPSCGTHSHSGSIDINIPSGDYSAVIRWHYASDNYAGEEFNTCSDVTVSSTGSNSHESPSIKHQEECNLLDDRRCTTGGGFKQCGAVLNGSGFWFPKSCPNGLVCEQDVASGNGVVGHVSCGRGD